MINSFWREYNTDYAPVVFSRRVGFPDGKGFYFFWRECSAEHKPFVLSHRGRQRSVAVYLLLLCFQSLPLSRAAFFRREEHPLAQRMFFVAKKIRWQTHYVASHKQTHEPIGPLVVRIFARRAAAWEEVSAVRASSLSASAWRSSGVT